MSDELPRTVIETPLVVLEPIDATTIADMLASITDPGRRHQDWHEEYPREDDRDGVGMPGAEATGWSSRQIRRRTDGRVVGTIGFFGPPEPAADGVPEVEIGYGLVAPARRQGLIGSALAALLALTDAAGVRVRAGTRADNEASLASLRSAGFVVRGGADESDPEREVLLARPLPDAAR